MNASQQPVKNQRPTNGSEAPRALPVDWLRSLSLIVFPGVYAGWRLRRKLGEREWAWRRRGVAHAARLLFIAASACSAVTVVWTGVGVVFADHDLPVHPIVALLTILLAQFAVGTSLALMTMPRRWGLMMRGELRAGQEDALAQAGWRAAVADAWTRIRSIRLGRCSWLGRYLHRTPVGYLGTVIADDHRWFLTRVLDKTRRRPRGWFTPLGLAKLPNQVPRILVLGASGHGKTVAITSVLRASLEKGHRTVFVDCKGNPDDAEFLLAMAEQMGKHAVLWPETPMDLWRGDRHAVVSIVKTLLPNHPYWDSLAGWVLDQITAEAGPWRSTHELFDRLLNPRSVVSDSKTLTALLQRTNSIPAHMAVYQAVAAQLAPIAHLIDGGPGSWALDDESVDLIVVSADIGAQAHLAGCLSGFVADLNAYRVARRDPNAKPLMVAFDEIQVLLGLTQPPDLAWLAEQVRSQNIGLLYATQSVAGLADSADRILGAGMELLVGRLDDPGRICEQTGTRRIAEHGWQKSLGDFTSVSTARTQHTYRLDPNRVREMPQGTWALISQGRIAYLAIEQPYLGPAVPHPTHQH